LVGSKTKVRFRLLSKKKPVYGITIPRHIAQSFLDIEFFKVTTSGNGIVLEPYDEK
jgi:hypothetical protein